MMGEEPERLQEALGTALEVLRINAEVRSDGPDYIGLTMDESRALLAEVERLAGERDELRETLVLIRDYRPDHPLSADAQWLQGSASARLRGFPVDQAKAATERAAKAEAECERLAGRVAALESELNRMRATEGLPTDLARVLRDPTIVVPRDHEIRLADGRTLHEHLEEWRNAPSNTASADLPADVGGSE